MIIKMFDGQVTVIQGDQAEGETPVVVVTRPAMLGGMAMHTIISPYDAKQIADYLLGRFNRHRMALIQEIFPNMSAEDREFLMTGITPAKWNEMFPKDKEEQDQ